MLESLSVRKILSSKFATFWPDFLLFNIQRTKRINEVMGHPLDGQIMLIVCWHHFLTSTTEQDQTISTFDECIHAWHGALHDSEADNEVSKKLTISSISMSTGMPFETVRRRVQNLKKQGWLDVCKKNGVIYPPTPENNDRVLNDIMEEEKKLVVTMINKFLK